MGKRPLIAIEHLEEELSPWLYIEYRHSCMLAKCNIMITNLPEKYHRLLKGYGCKTSSRSILDMYDHRKILILDPQATSTLTYRDLCRVDVVVIGGILGDHPPRGRTKKLLSSRAPEAIKRNIGKGQYSIDGAVYVVLKLLEKRDLSAIKYVDGIIIKEEVNGISREIYLPFRYPLDEHYNPVLAPGLKEYLLHGKLVSTSPNEIKQDECNNDP